MPLDAATIESGCMRFIPGSHRGEVRPHRHLGDDADVHALFDRTGRDRHRARRARADGRGRRGAPQLPHGPFVRAQHQRPCSPRLGRRVAVRAGGARHPSSPAMAEGPSDLRQGRRDGRGDPSAGSDRTEVRRRDERRGRGCRPRRSGRSSPSGWPDCDRGRLHRGGRRTDRDRRGLEHHAQRQPEPGQPAEDLGDPTVPGWA